MMFNTSPATLRKRILAKSELQLIDAQMLAEEWQMHTDRLKKLCERLRVEIACDTLELPRNAAQEYEDIHSNKVPTNG